MKRFLIALLSVFALAMPARAFVSVTWNGVTYSIPESGDLNWSSLTTFLQALGNNAGVAKQMKQAVRVATTSPVTVSATADFTVVTKLSAPGPVAVNLPAGIDGQIFIIMDGQADAATNNVTITPASGTIAGGASLVLDHNSEAVLIQYHAGTTDWKLLIDNRAQGTLTNNDISASAGILRSKLASGTANHVVINNVSGVMTSEETLAKSRGGSGQDNSSLTFPASGTLATLAGTEAFTNKTLTAGLFDSYVDYAHISTPATPAAGRVRVYAKSDNNLYRVDPNGVEQKIGSGASGSGETNYITNPSAAADLTGWTLVNSGLALARTTTAANLPRENTTGTGISILGTSGTESSADYVHYAFTLDDVDLNRVLKIQFDQKIIGAYTAGLLAVTITDTSNNLIATPTVTAIPASDGTFGCVFTSTSTAALRLKIAATGAIGTGAGIVISNVVVGPGTLVQGAPIGDWKAFTPTWSSSPTLAVNTGWYRQEGDSVRFRVFTKYTSGGAGAIRFTLPNSWQMDSNKVDTTATNNEKFGSGFHKASASNLYTLGLILSSTTTIDFERATGTNFGYSWTDLGASDLFTFEIILPISGFSSGVYLGSGADTSVTPLNWTDGGAWSLSTGAFGTTSVNKIWYRRIGDSMELRGEIRTSAGGTAGSGQYNIGIPGGFLYDTTKGNGGGGFVGSTTLGACQFNDITNSKTYTGTVEYDATSASYPLTLRFGNETTAPTLWASSNLSLATTSFRVSFYAVIPITGWTAQDYLGKVLTGWSTAKVGLPGIVNNDSSNTAGTPIKGKTDGSTTTAGYVGEQLRCVVTSSTNVPGASGAWGNMCSLNLTKGTWDLTGVAVTVNNGATMTSLEVGIGSTSNSGAGMVYGDNRIATLMPTATIANNAVIPQYRVELAADTTYYFEINASYSVATPQFFARFSAVRVN